MDNFEKFIRFICENIELYYSRDHAGDTVYGITRKNFPDSKVFKIFDDSSKSESEKRRLCLDAAVNDYLEMKKATIIDKLPFEIGALMFDMMVNAGYKASIKVLQMALNLIRRDGVVIKVDGIYGEETDANLKYILNKFGVLTLMLAYNHSRIAFYNDLVMKDPNKYKKYIFGWINRCYRVINHLFSII